MAEPMTDLQLRLEQIAATALLFPAMIEAADETDQCTGTRPPEEEDASPSSKSSKGSASICAGSVISVVSGICDTHRDDVLDSTLFAQGAANAKYQRETQTSQWYGIYVQTLVLLGWNVAGFSFTKCVRLPSQFQLSKQLLGLTSRVLPASSQALLLQTVQTLGGFKSSGRHMTLFGQNAVAGGSSNFQLGVVQESKQDEISMQMTAVLFQSAGLTDDLLFQSFSGSKANLYEASQTLALDDNTYAQMRDTVKQQLAGQTQQMILSIPLG
uniref:Uncharacterized protein n=1 Tax=Paenibacillus athensensis TaxID=1967502 RepID=A0A4Y8PZ14_9BACL